MSAASRRRRAVGPQYVWAFERPDTSGAAEAAAHIERAYARPQDAEAALASAWQRLHAAGVTELRLCDRLTVIRVVQLPLE
jgi:hypothetical protein